MESREGRDRHDRQVIRSLVPPDGRLAYEHMRPREEPLLWFADALAWSWGAGGDARAIVEAHDSFALRRL